MSLHQGPDVALSEMAQAYIVANPSARLTFREALDAVRATPEGLRLMRRYNASAKSALYYGDSANEQHAYAQALEDADPDPVATARERVSDEIHGRALKITTSQPKTSYKDACRRVLRDDPALARKYAEAFR